MSRRNPDAFFYIKTDSKILSDRLAREAEELSENPEIAIVQRLEGVMFYEAIAGDQGMMKRFLKTLIDRVEGGSAMSARESIGLAVVLNRILSDPRGVQIACGASNQRGGAKQGQKSLKVAFQVLTAITHGTCNSFEEAWAKAAADLHLSESMVKQYWMERRPLIMQLLGKPVNLSAAQIIVEAVADGTRRS